LIETRQKYGFREVTLFSGGKVSQWSDYLLSEVESYEVGADSLVLWYLGGAGFVIRTSKSTVYIDPYFGPSISPDWVRMISAPIDASAIRRVDLLVSTHEHEDHCDRVVVEHVGRNTQAMFMGPETSVTKAREWGFLSSGVVEMKPHVTKRVRDFAVTALPALDSHAEKALTYMLEAGGITVFHSGDSAYFNGFREFGEKWRVDVALLNLGRNPPGDTYYMTACDVVRAAMDLGARIVIPMHWDLWKRTCEDPRLVKLVADEWQAKIRVVVLRLGDRFEVQQSSKT
jgi:L-ascorbate 6-phosphate lactonase